MKILLVKTSSMGDVLHTLPALTDALNQVPNLKVDWVVEENFSQIPSWHPAVNQVIPIALRRWRKNWFAQEIKTERKAFINSLKKESYDAIIDAQGLFKSAFFVVRHAQGTKHGYDFTSAREGIASFFYDIRHNISKEAHAVERIRALFAHSLKYPLPSEKGDYAIKKYFTDILSPPHLSQEKETQPYFVFLHSTTREEKHWPESHWITLITELRSSGFHIKLPWGTQLEKERAHRLAHTFENVEVLPKLTLAEIAKEIAQSQGVISVDTGLSHLTAALDKVNITLYGPTDPKLIGGYGKEQHKLVSKTGNLNDLQPKEVLEYLHQINIF